MSKIVFCDFDGVLVPFASVDKKRRPAVADPGCIANLNNLVSQTGAEIVLTTSWRTKSSFEKLVDCMKGWGFVGKIIGSSPVLCDMRGLEIQKWLMHANMPIESFVILDDLDMRVDPLTDFLVKTWPLSGLTAGDVAIAVSKLESRK
jgi:hypothetical protein